MHVRWISACFLPVDISRMPIISNMSGLEQKAEGKKGVMENAQERL